MIRIQGSSPSPRAFTRSSARVETRTRAQNRVPSRYATRSSLDQHCGAPERNHKQTIAGQILEDGPTDTLQDAQGFELLRFRLDYTLRKAGSEREWEPHLFPNDIIGITGFYR